MIPEASDEEAEPTVCEMFASRMEPMRPNGGRARNARTVRTAIGIEVLIVSPTRRPR